MRAGRPSRCAHAALLAGLLALPACATRGPDPWEPVNRPVFGFNEGVDRYALEPVARGWEFAVPEVVQTGVDNFLDNLDQPMVFANDLLQGKPVAAAQDVARFAVNTTAGVLGFVDVATRIGIPGHEEDFGQTLGVWGVPAGPYVVLPLLGPSSVRDTLAWPVDAASQVHRWFIPGWVSWTLLGIDVANTRAAFLEEVAENRREALDYYAFVRNAYLQNRQQRIRDGAGADEAEDDLYYLDEIDEGEPGPGTEAGPDE